MRECVQNMDTPKETGEGDGRSVVAVQLGYYSCDCQSNSKSIC